MKRLLYRTVVTVLASCLLISSSAGAMTASEAFSDTYPSVLEPVAPIDCTALLNSPEALTWMFIGDSISAPGANGTNANWTQLVEQRIKVELKREKDLFINAAVAGFGDASFNNYFEQRVGRYKPDVVFIFLGMNGGHVKEDVLKMYESIRSVSPAAVIIPIITTPQKYVTYDNLDYGERKTYESSVINRQAAQEFGLEYIDLFKRFLDMREEYVVKSVSEERADIDYIRYYFRGTDDIHIDVYGHLLAAKFVLQGLNLWDLDNSPVCQYIENERYTWSSFKAPYVEIDRSAVQSSQFPELYARFMAALAFENKEFPLITLLGGSSFAGCSTFTGLRNAAQNIANVVGLRSSVADNPYNSTRVFTAGVMDGSIDEMAAIFRDKAAQARADLVLFMPDIAMTRSITKESLETYRASLADIYATAQSYGSQLAIVTPPLVQDTVTNYYAAAYVDELKAFAAQHSLSVIDFNQLMIDTKKNHPEIMTDWYDTAGHLNITGQAVLSDTILNALGYVDQAGLANYMNTAPTQAPVYNQQELSVKSQTTDPETGEWIITFDVSGFGEITDVYGRLNNSNVDVEQNQSDVTVRMPRLTNSFSLYYTKNGVSYYSPPFQQFVKQAVCSPMLKPGYRVGESLSISQATLSFATSAGPVTRVIPGSCITVKDFQTSAAGQNNFAVTFYPNERKEYAYTMAYCSIVGEQMQLTDFHAVKDDASGVLNVSAGVQAKDADATILLALYDADGTLCQSKAVRGSALTDMLQLSIPLDGRAQTLRVFLLDRYADAITLPIFETAL